MTNRVIILTTYRKASFWRRLGAYLLDAAMIGIVVFAFELPFRLDDTIVDWLRFFLFYSYNISMEYYFGGSLGKMTFNLRVISADKKRLSFLSSFFRNLGKIFSALTLMQGFLRILAPHQRQTIHDEFSKCYVVEVTGERRVTGSR